MLASNSRLCTRLRTIQKLATRALATNRANFPLVLATGALEAEANEFVRRIVGLLTLNAAIALLARRRALFQFLIRLLVLLVACSMAADNFDLFSIRQAAKKNVLGMYMHVHGRTLQQKSGRDHWEWPCC